MNGLIGFSRPHRLSTGASNNMFAVDNDTGFPVVASSLRCTAPGADCHSVLAE